MSNIKHEILFDGFGLNQDNDLRYMPNGSAPYAMNILKGEDGSVGVITNLKGNRVITYKLGLANTYFVLGSGYDGLTRNMYYLIFSQPFDVTGSGDYEHDNRLVQFNEDSEQIETIFYDAKNYFRLDPNKTMKDIFVLGKWLFFNPRTSEPKMIHIDMAYNYTNYDGYSSTEVYVYGNKVTFLGGLFKCVSTTTAGQSPVTSPTKWEREGDSYQFETDLEFDSEFRYAFFEIKHIPVYRPICFYGSDPDKNANNVRGKLFRFSHRYKYFDDSYSRFGGFSDITLPQNDEYYNGEVPGDLDQYNFINVKVPLHSPALIKEIDIIFQETGGDWKRAKIINRRDIELLDQLYYTYKFYNTDSAYEAIDDTYFNEAYDSVPREASAQELINKNILCYAGCKEGFDNIPKNEIDVVLTPEMIPLSIPEGMAIGGLRRDCVASYDISYFPEGGWPALEGSSWRTRINMISWYPNGMAPGDVFKITIGGVQKQYLIQAGDTASLSAFTAALGVFLGLNFPTITWYDDNEGIEAGADINITECIFYELSGSAEASTTKARGFKTGAWHPFCVYYYDDAMRRWDAQTSKENIDGTEAWEIDGTTVYVPMLGELSPTPLTTANKWNINWKINHLPPTGAKWWRWGSAGNALASKFVQYIVSDIEDENTWTRLNIAPLQTIKTTDEMGWNQFPQSVIDPYAWQKGDRVRIITEASVGDMGAIVDGVYDFEILKYDDTTTPGEYWIYTQDFDFAAIGAGEDTLVEIYTPIKTESNKIFYEFGELMPIIEDSLGTLVHGAGDTGTQNQDFALLQPATGTFSSGDVYHILRTPSKPIATIQGYFHESQWYSDFYASDDWDKGRIGVETSFGERTLNIVRHSKQYLQNTQINGLSTFTGEDYKELNDVYGEIMRIIEIGDTLKVYQRKKPSSILIGRTEYVDAEGNSNIVQTSQRILGAIRYSSTDYGTEFPESISKNNRYVYGFDIYNGVMWRDSANGIFPISGRYESADGGGDYKMEAYFKQKAKDLLVSGIDGVDVMTVWDERHKNLYVIFKDIVTDSNNEAIMFHESSNRWICFTNMDMTYPDGWNLPIELDYWILKGFEGGLGYYFDLDTRFAVFDIITSTSVIASQTRANLVMELFTPDVVCDALPAATKTDLIITPPTPIGVVSYVYILVGTMNWTASQSGSLDRYGTQVSCYPSPAVITAIPWWITVATAWGGELSVGDMVADGDTIFMYPTVDNVDAVRSANLQINNVGYTDFDTILLTQGAPVDAPTIIMFVDGDNPTTTTFSGMSGSMLPGEVDVNITLTANNSLYGAGVPIQIHWRAVINGIDDTNNAWITVPNGVSDTQSIVLYNPVSTGSTLVIFVKAEAVSDGFGSPSLQGLTMSLYSAEGIGSSCLSDVLGFTFLSTDDTQGEGQLMTITAPPLNTTIITKPSWVTIWSLLGFALYEGYTIADGETVVVFPSSTNTEYYSRSGYITLTNAYGDSVTMPITQGASGLPPLIDPIATTIEVYSGDSYMTIPNSSAYANSGGTDVAFSFQMYHPLYDDGEIFTMFYRAVITRSGVPFIDSSGTFDAYANSSNTGTITTLSTLVSGDVLTLYFSSISF